MPGYDDYVDEGGGLLTSFAGANEDAYFVDGKFGTQLEIHVKLANPEDHPQISFGVVKNFFGTGPGWKVVKNGAEIEHESGPDKKFNSNTDMGRLMNQIKAIDPDGTLLANGKPTQAAFWKAIDAQWGPISWGTNEFTNAAGEVVPAKTKTKPMPVELLGQASSNGHVAEFNLESLGLTADIQSALTTAANQAKNHSEFTAKAAAVPGVVGTPVMEKLASSGDGPAIWEALKAF